MDKKYLFVGIFFALLISAGAYWVYKIPDPTTQTPSQTLELSDNITASDSATLGVETQNMEEKLVKEDLKVGNGIEAIFGKNVTVNYVGTLTNGQKFDSSYDRNEPFTFVLGAGEVIAGWDQGVSGMKVGGKRKLTIPPSLGYGSADLGTIPPNSTLVFEVELLDVK